ncbi:hypothetical protein JCM10207_004592 [Rhodosporidiobolus poonsookiae]
MAADDTSASLRTLLDAAVSDGAAPGLVACAFTRNGTFASSASGVSSVESKAPMTLDTAVWLASSSKPTVSLAALSIIEKEGFDLDSHDELVKVIPELGKDWPGTHVWTLYDGKDDKGEWKFKQATKGITLRQIMTHTSGVSVGYWSDELVSFREKVPDVPGEITNLINMPRLFEAGERYHYGANSTLLGLFLIRKTGKPLRKVLWDSVLEPLGCKPDTLDAFITPKMRENVAVVAGRNPVDQSFGPLPFVFETPQYEDEPPEGFMAIGDAPLYGKLPAYVDVLRTFFDGPSIVSPETWKKGTADDLKAQALSTPTKPFWYGALPWLTSTTEKWAELQDGSPDPVFGWNLLQTLIHRSETKTGLQPGTLEWAGLANTYYFVDPSSGVGGIISAQYFPFADPAMITVRDKFFSWVYEHAPKTQ